jgi:hypothetical protein
MLTSFVLSMALGAPVPVDPPAPVAGGVAPRLLELKADADGKIMVTVMRTTMEKVAVGGPAIAIAPGGPVPVAPVPPPAAVVREIPVTKVVTVELGDVKDLKIMTADGKKVEVDDAVKQLKGGAVVVVSSDGQPVNPRFLKAFKDEVLVLTAPELINLPRTGPMPGGPIRPRPPVVQPLPAPVPPQAVPGNPGGLQIQIQPGVIQLAPVPALPPVVAPEK